MILQPHITQLEKLAKALLYLMVLLCLPDASVYASSTQKQAADFVRTEIVFSRPQLTRKTISYQQAVAKCGDSKILSPVHQLEFTQLILLHDKDVKVVFAHISKQCLDYASLPYLHQLRIIPQSSDDLPAYLSRG
jgi:hypothetical protein